MDVFANLLVGLQTAMQPTNLLFCLLGVTLGTFIGVLPGVGTLAALAMLLPITFHLEPLQALIMLAGAYYGTEYGGSTASILLRLPGSPSNAITCLDGYPMAQKGRAGIALLLTGLASFVGGSIAIVLTMIMAPAISRIALAFGPAEYCAVMIFGLVAAATIAQGAPIKGVAMVILGLLLSTIGMDINSGVPRFAFGVIDLYDGIGLAALAMGLFGVSELIASVNARDHTPANMKVTLRSMLPTRDDWKRSVFPTLRGAGIGSAFGVLPGTGPTIASLMSYATEKQIAKDKSRFGHGAVEGITAPESSNNAAAQASFIPTLSLGIPGSPTMAIMLGAMMIHGIAPGPAFLDQHQGLFWGLVGSFWIGNILLIILNVPLIGMWVSVLRIPYKILFPVIIGLICIGVFAIRLNLFDVFVVLAFGLIGYGMRLVRLEPAPLLIGFILGPMIEENLRRALLLSGGNYATFVERPISAAFMAMSGLLLIWLIYSAMKSMRSQSAESPAV